MIIEAKALKLLEIYFYVCKRFEEDLKYCCERHSNNSKPDLTDEEIMTIYLFVAWEEQRLKVKQIYRFADEYLRSWFPDLGSYAAFDNRLNRLSEAFRQLIEPMLLCFSPKDCSLNESVLDSMPIITCSGKRAGRVAPELTRKGYCSTKSMYYFGLKLHVLAFRRMGKLPFPEQLVLTAASVNDLTVFKQYWATLTERIFYGDKIYCDNPFFDELKQSKQSTMLTPVKAIKGQSEWEKKFAKAANDLFSRAVSTIRQPIESLFNWLNEKTEIQTASKVRSTKGLLVHVFGKIAVAFLHLIFNP